MNPVLSYLHSIHERLASEKSGDIANYIPELARADPSHFGICIVTSDGEVYSSGDTSVEFTIQSMSKPFMYGEALRKYGRESVLRKVGVEPTGDAFNAIVLDEKFNRPFNPMVNAGAIAVADLLGSSPSNYTDKDILNLFSTLAGRQLSIDKKTFDSETLTGHRNRAISYLMLNSGMIGNSPDDVLRLYFSQCSIRVNCIDMAMMAATLAARGKNPKTGAQVLDPIQVRDILTVMTTCGMYDNSGQWAYEIGLPAKSGVSGGIFAVMPGQAGIAVYSPPLDNFGNSVRGIEVCRELSRSFSLHVFDDQANGPSVIRQEARGDRLRSKRLRSTAELEILAQQGRNVSILQVQGTLFFGSTESIIRRLDKISEENSIVIIDFARVTFADPSAITLLENSIKKILHTGGKVIISGTESKDAFSDFEKRFLNFNRTNKIKHYDNLDQALESCEERILYEANLGKTAKYALRNLDIFQGLNRDELRILESLVNPLFYEAGSKIISKGDPADAIFIIASGSAVISIAAGESRRKRLSSIGPGYSIGEMALINGGLRTADVYADGSVTCYCLTVDQIQSISNSNPNIMITILRNIIKTISSRLAITSETF